MQNKHLILRKIHFMKRLPAKKWLKMLKTHECQISADNEQQGPGSHVSLKTCGSNI